MRRLRRAFAQSSEAGFISSAPSPQTAIDAVPDRWASRFPPPLDGLSSGDAALFEDPRITWALERLGGAEGKTVLDLGPLEGAYSYMAQQAGARRVVGVEANTLAFLKCLVTKELLELNRCSFLCGDVLEYMRGSEERFDLCIASGILYHMVEPVRLLHLISKTANQLIMWTHVYSEQALENRGVASRLSPAEEQAYEGLQHRVLRYSYGRDNRFQGFWGGTSAYSNWLPREDLMRALDYFGWTNVQVAFDEPYHPNGPALALVAERTNATGEPASAWGVSRPRADRF